MSIERVQVARPIVGCTFIAMGNRNGNSNNNLNEKGRRASRETTREGRKKLARTCQAGRSESSESTLDLREEVEVEG